MGSGAYQRLRLVAMATDADLWAVVPAKPFDQAKRRLAAVLDPGERRLLARLLLDRTLALVGEVVPAERIGVVSRDPEALAAAAAVGALPLLEGGRGLNPALRQAAACCRERGAASLLVVASDLPCLVAAELRAFVGAAAGAGVAIAPNRRRSGTNVLFLRPPDVIGFAFGRGSFQRHLALARAAGHEPAVVELPGLGFDLDLPDDLTELNPTARAALGLTPDRVLSLSKGSS